MRSIGRLKVDHDDLAAAPVFDAPRVKLGWSASNTRLSCWLLLAADLAAGLLSYVILLTTRTLIWGEIPAIHWAFWSSGVAWLIFRAGNELYRPFGLYPPQELSRSFQTTVAAMAIHFIVLVADGQTQPWRLYGLLIWVGLPPLTYAFRSAVRAFLVRQHRYGVPLAIIGNGRMAERAVRELLSHPEIGFVPVAVFWTDSPGGASRTFHSVPIVGSGEEAPGYPFDFGIQNALIAVDDPAVRLSLSTGLARRFRHLLTFDGRLGESSWLARTRPIGPYLMIETCHARFSELQLFAKRCVDIAVSLPVILAASPAILICGIIIAIRDPGPIFFSQIREGKGGKPIRIYKLRSMVVGAEAKLASYLAENEAARFEYERTMKIRQDPRIIPGIGKFLRKSSIDEIPQLWSVLKGDMSLVGPRVMPTREIILYSSGGQQLRREALPGLTGFWQVEHRNDSDFKIREVADSFYVSNWSIWFDLWIILRTFKVVLTGAGAV